MNHRINNLLNWTLKQEGYKMIKGKRLVNNFYRCPDDTRVALTVRRSIERDRYSNLSLPMCESVQEKERIDDDVSIGASERR